MPDDYIAALLNERASYVARGRKDRVAEVDRELARLGHSKPDAEADAPKPTPEAATFAAPESTDMPSPRRRSHKES